MNQSYLPSCQWSAPPAHRAEPIICSQPIKLTAYRFSQSRKPSLHKVKVICWTACQATSHRSCCHRRGSVLFLSQTQPEFQFYTTMNKLSQNVSNFSLRASRQGEVKTLRRRTVCWLSPHKDNLRANREKKILVFFIQTSKKEKQFHLFIRFNFIYTAFLTIKIVSRCFIKLDKLQNRRRRDIRHEWKCISQDLQTQACLLFLTALWNLENKIPKHFPHSTGTILSCRRPRIKLNGERRRGSYKICIDRVWAEGYFKALPCDVCDMMLKWPRGFPFGVKKGY